MGKDFEILFITDINTDGTVELLADYNLKHRNVKAIKLSNSFGQHIAVMAGLDHSHGKYIVIMDGDMQDLPEDIPLLYNKIIEGYDVVYTVKEKKNDNFIKNVCSKAFNALMNKLSDIKIKSNSSMFRIISRKALEEIIKFREHEPSLTYISSFINLPTSEVRVSSGVRKSGTTKYGLLRLINHAMSSLLSFSRKPLKMISGFGLFMSILSFIYFIVILYQYFFYQIQVQGWATIVSIVTFIGGIQMLSLGVIGEYVGRMYMQTKNRPLYIVEKKYGDFN